MNLDNVSTINIAKILVSYGWTKHIETKFHFLREEVNKGKLRLAHCKSKNQIVDIFFYQIVKKR